MPQPPAPVAVGNPYSAAEVGPDPGAPVTGAPETPQPLTVQEWDSWRSRSAAEWARDRPEREWVTVGDTYGSARRGDDADPWSGAG
eukprot:7645865-Prorocentrum_lima.AAC.1